MNCQLNKVRVTMMAAALLALVMVGSGGCASSSGPESLRIPASQYAQAFDAALAVVKDEGFVPALRDRRSGMIETEPLPASTALEPWHDDKASLDQAVENTVAYQRRRVRFEFSQDDATHDAGPEPRIDAALEDDVALHTATSMADLTQVRTGDLQLRVWVFVERANTPGLRRFAWTRRTTTTARLVAPEGDTGEAPPSYWTPVTRDLAYERRLLAQVQEAIETTN